MQYFTEQAPSHHEVLEKIRRKYGERAKILTHRTVRLGGFMGMFSKEGVEMTGYIAQETPSKQKARVQEEKQKILDSVKGDKTLQKVLEEVQSLKQQFESYTPPKVQEDHSVFSEVTEVLSQNEFSFHFIQNLLERLRQELSYEQLNDTEYVLSQVLEWIGECVPVKETYREGKPRILILVGPTGVGKTTTIAKLAAIHSLGSKGERSKDVRIITIDNYRIGAKQQIRTYAEILQVPFTSVESFQDLQNQIALDQDADLVLIDTIGKSPKDYMNLAKMREILDGCGGKAEIHLAVSATTKVSDLKEIMQQFEPFNYEAVVLTKLDETMRIGNLISVLNERGKQLSYVADGQRVPEDIQRATRIRMLKTLEGFPIHVDRLKQKFGEVDHSEEDGTDGNDAVTPAEQEQLYRVGKEMTKTKRGEK
ncbi:MAG: flagellar biosynthesis protein FlhF [Spirochaetaceae bacterium]|nr:flagellar biosynthesis protein FlhF [Spirochaetaceae bacterium]MCF7947116.1 flagellar biosynthesis protein FlhF [Spirochaetia bacterium]MCF7950117.1 flagellar biosynthesis protein FlhF [Spirochaetaceae bacterium]